MSAQKAATISKCGQYRYTLERATKHGTAGCATLAWIMLNPSTADEMQDDPTIRKVIGFTERSGFGKALVVNLFAYRATSPKIVRGLERRRVDGGCPEGPGNLDAIRSLRDRNVSTIVCAWGSFPWAARQVARVRPHLYGLEYVCLGMGASGPRHPLYVRYDQRFVPFVF